MEIGDRFKAVWVFTASCSIVYVCGHSAQVAPGGIILDKVVVFPLGDQMMEFLSNKGRRVI